MEFILNNKKYSIINQELLINYLMVDSYFRQDYSKYDYNIEFDFITPLLSLEKIEFKDINTQTEILNELIEKEEINFIAQGVRIDEHLNGNFKISYQDIELNNVKVGHAVPVLIALYALINYKPVITLAQISDEIHHFLDSFNNYEEK